MKYTRFEDTPAWKAGADLVVRVILLVDNKAFSGRGDLRDQLQRAALSVSNNIAEGFERGSTNELLTFLYYARGSAGEVRSMLAICERLPFLSDFKFEISNLKSLADNIGRQLQGWADSLQNSEIKGAKYLNDAVRAKSEQTKRADALLARIRDINEASMKQRLATQDGSQAQPPHS